MQQRVLKPAVESDVNRQLHISLASPAVADTLTAVIADLARLYDGVDWFTTIMTTNPTPERLRVALLAPETLRRIAAHLVTVPDFKDSIDGAVLSHVQNAIA